MPVPIVPAMVPGLELCRWKPPDCTAITYAADVARAAGTGHVRRANTAAAATPSTATIGQGCGRPATPVQAIAASAGTATAAASAASTRRAAVSLDMAGDQRQSHPGRAPSGRVIDVERPAEQREPGLHRQTKLSQIAADGGRTGDAQLEAVVGEAQPHVDLGGGLVTQHPQQLLNDPEPGQLEARWQGPRGPLYGQPGDRRGRAREKAAQLGQPRLGLRGRIAERAHHLSHGVEDRPAGQLDSGEARIELAGAVHSRLSQVADLVNPLVQDAADVRGDPGPLRSDGERGGLLPLLPQQRGPLAELSYQGRPAADQDAGPSEHTADPRHQDDYRRAQPRVVKALKDDRDEYAAQDQRAVAADAAPARQIGEEEHGRQRGTAAEQVPEEQLVDRGGRGQD